MTTVPLLHAELAAEACRVLSRVLSAVAVEAGGVAFKLGRSGAMAGRRSKEAEQRLAKARGAVSRRRPIAWVPLLGSMMTGPARKRAAAAFRSFSVNRDKAAALGRKSGSARRLQEKCLLIVGRLDLCAIDVAGFGEPPAALKSKIRTVCNRGIFLTQQRDKRRVKDILLSALELLAVVAEWTGTRQLQIEQRRRTAAGVGRVVPVRPAAKIFLPVPLSMERSAVARGAYIDKSATSSSRVFLTPSDDLKSFARMLPLAYRAGGAGLHFPPIPAKAARHNIWSLFDQETWDRIRHSAYEATGRRCVVCGGRGGFFARRVLGPDGRGAIDCHETWNWIVEDPTTGVGLQKLDRLLTVCVDCHMMFHEGFALDRASDVGLRDEMFERINDRRMTVDQMDQQQLTLLLEEDREAWRATDGIDNWIIDLSHLSGHLPAGTEPIFLVDNAAGVVPERIGGLAFQTDDGRSFPSRPAEDLFAAEMQKTEAEYNEMRQGMAGHLARRLGPP